jgi:hypothetical protein
MFLFFFLKYTECPDSNFRHSRRLSSRETLPADITRFDSLDAVQGLHDDGHLVQVDHPVVVHVVQLEGPVQLGRV